MIPYFAVGGHAGTIQLWNYISKTLVSSRKFETDVTTSISLKNGKQASSTEVQVLKISSMAYNSEGSILAVGFSNGGIKLLDGEKLTDHFENLSTTNAPPQPPFPYESEYTRNETEVQGRSSISISNHALISLRFSECGKYLAVADEGYGVSLIKLEPIVEAPIQPVDLGASITPPKDLSFSASRTGRLGNASAGELMKKYQRRNEKEDAAASAAAARIKSSMHIKRQWVFYGRNKAHFEKVVELLFIDEGGEKVCRLISIGRDRHVCEYNVEEASISGGFNLKVLLIPCINRDRIAIE